MGEKAEECWPQVAMAAIMRASLEHEWCATVSFRPGCGGMCWKRVHRAAGARWDGGGVVHGGGGGIGCVMGGGFVAGL